MERKTTWSTRDWSYAANTNGGIQLVLGLMGTQSIWMERRTSYWPFQEPKLEVPTGYLPYIRPISKAYVKEYPQKIWPYMVQYLHFRILKFPLNIRKLNEVDIWSHLWRFSEWDSGERKTLLCWDTALGWYQVKLWNFRVLLFAMHLYCIHMNATKSINRKKQHKSVREWILNELLWCFHGFHMFLSNGVWKWGSPFKIVFLNVGKFIKQ